MGQNLVQIIGHLYGQAVSGPTCYINNSRNVSTSSSSTQSLYEGGDGIAPQFISVSHIASEIVNSIDYSGCTSPTPGSVTTQLISPTGSIDTSNNNCTFADCDLYAVGEIHQYAYGNDALQPVTTNTDPPQSPTFQSRSWQYPDGWIHASSTVSICNTIIQILVSGGQPSIGPMGCITLYLP